MKRRNIHLISAVIAAALSLSAAYKMSAASAASFNFGQALKSFSNPGAAPQHFTPQVQELEEVNNASPSLAAVAHDHTTPLEGGSVLEFHDGLLSCQPATDEEVRLLRRNPEPEMSVIRDQSFGANALEQTRRGLKIILRGTPQLEQFPEAKAAFLRATQTWESLIQNSITVVIDVDFGPTFFGMPYGERQGGQTRFQRKFNATAYSTIRSALIQSAGSPKEAALYNSLPPAELPTDLGAATGIIYHIPTLRALGLFPPVADPEAEREILGLPPGIGFNSATDFDFDPSDGIKPKRFDFNALAIHEIGHALGYFSGVGLKELHPELPPMPDVLDLFRFRPGQTIENFASAPRILSSGGEHIFFDGGLELPLSTGRDDSTGGDGRQAGHWKDERFTGRYIGIMHPSVTMGYRFSLTANDLQALELMGYRTNPLPKPQEAELKLDDGAAEILTHGNGLIVFNRVTPPSYPAVLRKLRILIPVIKNQPDPRGKPITLLIYAENISNGQSPPSAQLRRIATTVPSAHNELFLEFEIPDGPTINSGDFFVGYQAPSPQDGVGFAVDLSGSEANRSIYSTNNGASFAPLADLYQGKAANAMIRALVSTGGPTPTPTPNPTPKPTPVPTTSELTSGVSQDGSIYDSSPGGKTGNIQYTIQVPSGATQLKIDLNANTDVDLYLRFGSLITNDDGSLVADFKSVSDNHHESIAVTPASSPALKAGVYYMAIVNYGPGPSNFTITATVSGDSNPTPAKVVSVSAANFSEGLASEAIAAAFGTRLATTTQVANSPLPTELAGTRVLVTDVAGVQRGAPLFSVSPGQVNYLIPKGTASGLATVTVTSGDGTVSVGTARIEAVAPGLFTANGDGQGAPAALAMRYQANESPITEPVAQFDPMQKRFFPRPLDLGSTTDQTFLILFGTGLRHRQALSMVGVRIGDVEVPVDYAGPQDYLVGVDQINVRLPRSLIGRGEVEVILTVDGRAANKVSINLR